MSFEAELQTAVITALAEEPEIAAQANGVFLERPVRAAAPYLVLGELLSVDWSVKGATGREVRLIVRIHDKGESWARVIGLRNAAGRAVEMLPREIGSWRLGAITFLRARVAREGSDGWLGAIEYRVRGMEE